MRNLKVEAIEARWGLPLPDLIRDFHHQGLSQADTARALGYDPAAFCAMVNRDGLANPWHRVTRALEYFMDTGEAFREAVLRLAATTHITAAALELGYASPKSLRRAMRNHGIDATFQPYVLPRKDKPEPTRTRITADEADRYLAMRASGFSSTEVALALNRERAALWKATVRLRPEAAAQLRATRDKRRRERNQQRSRAEWAKRKESI